MSKALCRYRAAQTHQPACCCVTAWIRTPFIPDFSSPPYFTILENIQVVQRTLGYFLYECEEGMFLPWERRISAIKCHTLSQAHQASPPSAINRWKKTFLLCLSLNLLTVITPFKMSFCLVVYWSLAPRFLAFPTCMHTLFLLRVTTETNRWWLGGVSPR